MVDSYQYGNYNSTKECEDLCFMLDKCQCYSYNKRLKLCFLFEPCSRFESTLCSKYNTTCGHVDFNLDYISNEMGGCLQG